MLPLYEFSIFSNFALISNLSYYAHSRNSIHIGVWNKGFSEMVSNTSRINASRKCLWYVLLSLLWASIGFSKHSNLYWSTILEWKLWIATSSDIFYFYSQLESGTLFQFSGNHHGDLKCIQWYYTNVIRCNTIW